MTIEAIAPFQMFFDLDGSPLDNGLVWIGRAGGDPKKDSIPVYFDEESTSPIEQPIRTTAGYAWRRGTPTKLYVGENFSILVEDHRGCRVYESAFNRGTTVFDPTAFVPFTGGTMAGFLSSHADPEDYSHYANKGWVDAEIKANKLDPNDFIAKAGDTMDGFLTLHAAPKEAMHAANMGYVKDQIAEVLAGEPQWSMRLAPLSGDPPAGWIAMAGQSLEKEGEYAAIWETFQHDNLSDSGIVTDGATYGRPTEFQLIPQFLGRPPETIDAGDGTTATVNYRQFNVMLKYAPPIEEAEEEDANG